MIDYFNGVYCQTGALPAAGGVWDQTASFHAALGWLIAWRVERDARLAEKARREAARGRAGR